jgi:hypothetical protein
MSYNQVRATEEINKSIFRCLTFTPCGIYELIRDA